MTRYPLMQPKSGHKDLCYTPNNNTRYLVHELGSSAEAPGRVHHQDAAEASPPLPFNPQLPVPLVPTRGQKLDPAADGDQRRASHQRGGHWQVRTRVLGRHHHYFGVTPTSVVFGTVYSLQQLSLSLLNVSLVQVSTVKVKLLLTLLLRWKF